MASIHYRSYAKINLYLDVLNQREDGYHNIETVFQTVSLHDDLVFTPHDEGIHLYCDNSDVPLDERNLIHRAARLLQEQTGCGAGVKVKIKKRIPVAAGLAGGSGNAAATLVALNKLWELGLSRAKLRALGLELGSDVPYCLVGGTVAATRRGEELFPLPKLMDTWFVLLHPPLAISTETIFTSPHLVRNDEAPYAGRTYAFGSAIRAIKNGYLAAGVFNRLESAAFALHPELAERKQQLIEAGCRAAAMSGSGPTLFGICESQERAETIAAQFTDIATSIVTPFDQSLVRLSDEAGTPSRHVP